MAKLNLPTTGTEKPTAEVDERITFRVNRNVTPEQALNNVVAKVRVEHPAFSVMTTVWKRGTKYSVTLPQQKVTKEGKNTWYALVALDKDLINRIIQEVKWTGEKEPWYLEEVNKKDERIVTISESNDTLGIDSLVIDDELSGSQVENGMICKVNIITTAGTLYGYTIWNSRFGKMLYGSAPAEGSISAEKRGSPSYVLTEKAIAQVLSHIHQMVDFDAEVEVKPASNALIGKETPTFVAIDMDDDEEMLEILAMGT